MAAFAAAPLPAIRRSRTAALPRSRPSPRSPTRTPFMTLTPAPLCRPGVMSLQNEGAYAVMAAAAAVEQRTGRKVVRLEIGQPGFPTPPHVAQAGVDAIRAGRTKYTPPPGEPGLRARIAAATAARCGVHVTADMVVVGPGAKPGLFLTALALVAPGDRVVVPDPGFPTYRAMVEVAGGVVVPVRLAEDLRSFDMEALEREVRKGVKLVVLNSPGNPTGGVMPVEDLERIAMLAQKHDFWVISDEIYSQLCYTPYTSIASLPHMLSRTVIVDGFSKSYCMTGWRLGWAVMPRELAARVELLLVHSVGCTAPFVQAAGMAALDGAASGVEELRETYRRRRDLVVEGLNAMRGVRCAQPEGAFYAFADVSAFGKSAAEVARMLLEEGLVAVLPGTDFGNGGEGFIRLSYVSEEEELREGLRRIKAVLDALPLA